MFIFMAKSMSTSANMGNGQDAGCAIAHHLPTGIASG